MELYNEFAKMWKILYLVLFEVVCVDICAIFEIQQY
jgi:hypothetical protein